MPFEQYGSADPSGGGPLGQASPPQGGFVQPSPPAHGGFVQPSPPAHGGFVQPVPLAYGDVVHPQSGSYGPPAVLTSPAGYSAPQNGAVDVVSADHPAPQYSVAPATDPRQAYAQPPVPAQGMPNGHAGQPVYDIHAAQQAQYAQYLQAASQALPQSFPAGPEAVPSPYAAAAQSPYATIPSVAPPATPSRIRKVVPWVAGGVLVLGAAVTAGIVALVAGSGPTAAEAKTACETAFLDEMNARDAMADSSGSGLVATILNGVEVAEPVAVEGGFEVNGSGKYTMTSMGTSVPGSVALTCTAKHDDDGNLVTTVTNRSGGKPS
ncbi:hypothetical protein CLV67_109253 [Actinoplanes italicus]|uniref:Uncharacterized protein n=2 Tax=Actinoplanes italicus TaxID=113567 RepID=A0A2T0KA23_9ACTN|nr:hypothetical protein CLV67_109253 [Actinoplanes italicus]